MASQEEDGQLQANPTTMTSNGSRKRPRSSREPPEQQNISCFRCKEKKIRCDTEIPACRPCSRASASCVIVDSSTGKQYTRSQIQALHDQIQELEKSLQSRGLEPDQVQGTIRVTSAKKVARRTTQSRGHIPKFIGDESGTGFIQYILHAISRGWKDPSFPQSVQEGLSGPAVIDHPAHPLPSSSDGAKLVTLFLTGFHIQHSFLQRRCVHDLYQRVYERQTAPSLPLLGGSPNEKSDLFELNMIFALASVDEFRRGKSEKHPFGYFTAALQNLDGIMSFETNKDIQGFLLIAHFGLYYYIGCSIWEICQICLRICIEQGLHQPSRKVPQNLLVEQMRRRIFWNCYQLDRLSSVTLGRPYGIEDADIEVGLPFDAEDDHLEHVTQWSNEESSSFSGLSSSNGEVAVFNCSIRLGKIACRIHTSLNFGYSEKLLRRKVAVPLSGSRAGTSLEPGDSYQVFREFFMELRSWRMSCPIFQEPHCPSQTQEWFDFMYEREKLTLVRAVIDRVHSKASFPPKELLNPCHNTAVSIIHRYDDLRKRDQVTYSWSYMQLLLTCGLSVIFCVFVEVDSRQRQHSHLARSWLSRRWTDLEADTFRDFSLQESLSAIDACASVHSWMAEQSKEMGRYARFFNMMQRGIQEKIKQAENRNTISGQPNVGSSMTGGYGQNPTSTNGSHIASQQRPQVVMEQQSYFNNPGYIVSQNHNEFGSLEDSMFDPAVPQYAPSNWSGTDSENTFEPLVRQLFGTDPDFHIPDIDFHGLSNEFCTWDFSQNPLLAEFTSGLEGFM